MREREMLKGSKCLRVNSLIVGASINMVCEIILLQGLKKIMLKFHGDPTLR